MALKMHSIVIILLLFLGFFMLTTIRQIGNSKGLLIPAAFLASCQIQDQVDMQLQDGQIVIKPVKPVKDKLRVGWFEPAAAMSAALLTQENEQAQSWDAASNSDDSEWVW
jgi:antitoxin MazE